MVERLLVVLFHYGGKRLTNAVIPLRWASSPPEEAASFSFRRRLFFPFTVWINHEPDGLYRWPHLIPPVFLLWNMLTTAVKKRWRQSLGQRQNRSRSLCNFHWFFSTNPNFFFPFNILWQNSPFESCARCQDRAVTRYTDRLYLFTQWVHVKFSLHRLVTESGWMEEEVSLFLCRRT